MQKAFVDFLLLCALIAGNNGESIGIAKLQDMTDLQTACDTIHSPDDFIAGLSADVILAMKLKPEPFCASTATITNSNNGETIKVSIRDICQYCSDNDIYLSEGAFLALGEENSESFPVSWEINKDEGQDVKKDEDNEIAKVEEIAKDDEIEKTEPILVSVDENRKPDEIGKPEVILIIGKDPVDVNPKPRHYVYKIEQSLAVEGWE